MKIDSITPFYSEIFSFARKPSIVGKIGIATIAFGLGLMTFKSMYRQIFKKNSALLTKVDQTVEKVMVSTIDQCWNGKPPSTAAYYAEIPWNNEIPAPPQLEEKDIVAWFAETGYSRLQAILSLVDQEERCEEEHLMLLLEKIKAYTSLYLKRKDDFSVQARCSQISEKFYPKISSKIVFKCHDGEVEVEDYFRSYLIRKSSYFRQMFLNQNSLAPSFEIKKEIGSKAQLELFFNYFSGNQSIVNLQEAVELLQLGYSIDYIPKEVEQIFRLKILCEGAFCLQMFQKLSHLRKNLSTALSLSIQETLNDYFLAAYFRMKGEELALQYDCLQAMFLSKVKKLNLNIPEIDDESFKIIIFNYSLFHELNLCASKITDQSIQHLSNRMTDLKTIHLLDTLDIRFCTLTDGIGQHLICFANLKHLKLGGELITDKIGLSLKSLTHLESLTFAHCPITDKIMEDLQMLEHLKAITFDRCSQISSTVITRLGYGRRINFLFKSCEKIDQQSGIYLKNLSHLAEINFE